MPFREKLNIIIEVGQKKELTETIERLSGIPG